MPALRILFLLLSVLGEMGDIGAQSFSLSGRLTDRTSGEPLEFATVRLFSALDSTLIEGLITTVDGRFTFLESGVGEVYFTASFMGYETYYSTLFSGADGQVEVGDVALGFSNMVLAEIEVTGKQLTSVHRLDRQAYDAQQFAAARGGNAVDVLRNLPSLSVNANGQISFRGSEGFQLLLNGKPSQGDPATILRQLPANAIENIELITAPSARYDPDGQSGIINVVLRRGAIDGWQLFANLMTGLPSVEAYGNADNASRYGADLSLNYRRGPWELSAGMDYRRYDISGRREGYVNTFADGVLTEFPSDGERSFNEENYGARLSASFTPNQQQSITAGFYAGKRTKDRTADILYLRQQRTRIAEGDFLGPETYYDLYRDRGDVFNGGTVLNTLTYFNENLRVRKGDFLLGSLDYVMATGDSSKLTVSALYESTLLGGPTDNANLDFPNTTNVRQLQFNDNDNPLDGVRLRFDFSKRLRNGTLESGYQFRYLRHPGDFIYLDRDLDNQEWIENPLFTNGIDLRRSIHSAYGQFAGSAGKWAYALGLRLEYFDREVTIDRPDETFTLRRFNPFPSAQLAYEISPGLRLKTAYSRRIERTTTFKMTPFPEREHSETLEQGDARLLPEYIDQLELGMVSNGEVNSVFGTLYYRRIQDVINRVNTVFNDTILNRIYTNAGNARLIGLEVGTTLYPLDKWQVSLGGNVYNYRIRGDLFGDAINTATWVYSINATMDYTFSPSFSAQLALNYLSERVTAQGRDSRFYNPSLSFRKSFADEKWHLNFQWLNIDLGLLNSNEQRITTVRSNFFTTTNYVYEVDVLQLSIGYRLDRGRKRRSLPESEFGKKEF